MTVVSLIVMEPGSEWPGHVAGSENIVAAGTGGEALLERTQRMLGALRARSQSVRVAVLACRDTTDLDSARRRAEIATELLIAIAPVAFGRLVLCTGERPSHRLRRELLSLTDALCQELRGKTSTIALRFGASSDGWSHRAEPWAGTGTFGVVSPSSIGGFLS